MIFSSCSINDVEILIYRDDLNHPKVSGNKLHKLTPNLELAKTKQCSTVLSFGGPYSNHLHALAYACKERGLASIGMVRGELHEDLTPTLQDCQQWGMKLIPVQRRLYREFQEMLATYAEPCLASDLAISLTTDIPSATLVIAEGGSNMLAIQSIANAYKKVFQATECKNITHAICATGTGASLAGLYKAVPEFVDVIGIQAVAEQEATLNRVYHWLGMKPQNLKVAEGHLGGFGRTPAALLRFIEAFEATYNIPLDPIYNGKALFKVNAMIAAKQLKQSDKILYIHTGGLQGMRSIKGK